MRRVHWVRHGPTHERRFTGWRDVPADLSDTAAVARLAETLPSGAVIVASDLIRASATADAIAGARLRLPDMPDLRELNFGVWDGLSFAEVEAMHPKLSRAYWETPGDLAPPDGESWNAAARRVSDAIDAVLGAQDARDIIAVAHMGAIMTQIARTGGDAYAAMGHQIEPLSVTTLMVGPQGWHAERINHLA